MRFKITYLEVFALTNIQTYVDTNMKIDRRNQNSLTLINVFQF